MQKAALLLLFLGWARLALLSEGGPERRRLQVTQDLMPELNLKQMQLLQLIREEDIYSKIQNEKDDDQIYNYGLASLEHPEAMSKKSLTGENFPKAMSFLSRLNFAYNMEAKLLAFAQPLTSREETVEGLQVFEQTKSMLFTVLYDFQELGAEVELLFTQSDNLSLSVEDLVTLYGFGPLFDRLKANEGEIVSDTLAKLELKAYEWNAKARQFLEMAGVFRKINVPFYYYVSEIAEQVEQNFSKKSDGEAVRDASSILRLLLNLKAKTEFSVEAFQRSVVYLTEFRLVLLDLISRLQPGWYLQNEDDPNAQAPPLDDGSGISDDQLEKAIDLD